MTRQRDAQGRFTSSTSIVKVTDKRSITASVSDVPENKLRDMRSSSDARGMRAWKLWRILGVLHYPTSFMAEQVMRLDWDVSVDGRELEPEKAAEAIAAVTSPEGTREIARRLALNLEVAGEVYYVRSQDEWATISAAAPKLKERLSQADIAIRGWLADPVNTEEADSPVFSALDVAEELRVMAALSRSQTRNRLAQRGILLRPKEWTFPEGDDFTAKFRETISAPIADEYSAAAVTPLDIAGPAEYIDKWKHLVLEFPYDDKLDERIDNAIRRLALSLNMPPEVLLGNMDASHWNAWLSDEQTYRAHLQPLAYQVAQIFAKAMMKAAPSSGLIVVNPDPSELLGRRSSVADAFEAAKLGAVGLEYVRKAMGADEDDAPTPEDLAIVLALLGHATSAEPEMGIEQSPAAPPMPRATPNGNGQPAIAAAVSEDDAALDELGDRLADIDQNLLLRLQGAADMLASQVRSRVEADEVGVQEAIASEVERLSTTWGRMVDEGRRALRGLGIDAEGQEWEQAKAASRELLSDGMTAWLVDTLDRTDSEMGALPTDLLRATLAAAGGSGTAVVAALTAPRGILPQPTPADPQAFASGVLTSKALTEQGLVFKQWRWRYGTALRQHPFHWHKEQDGRFTDADGMVAGWYVGDHRGDMCQYAPVWRKMATATEEE